LFSENQALRIYKIITKSEIIDYYKNLGISYPNAKDIERAKKQNWNPGLRDA